ncbi:MULTISPECIES: hypothetical protein [Trichocoleus]|uniref:Uncharacterized protein n=1 Tax=Trichocoleus desertorum GB2-A4 TaxID=2933944 RepID=A0ABV0J275_9CYAN|nr:hypothetical protein [Trichocoleus sp. FACHB-46]MBD1860485.1 hypothetical protein [Trichocoleus sp. FACHB-46]
MPVSSLKSFLLPAVLLSSTVFSSLTLPLVMLGSQPIDIRVQQEPVFSGQLKDVAAPYLGFATALSLGAGIASVAVTGWRRSSRKSAQVEEQLSSLQENLQVKESQLEELKLSEVRLAATGLSEFLHDKPVQVVTGTTVDLAQPVVIAPSAIPTATAETVTTSQAAVKTDLSRPVSVQAAVSALHPAQAFLSFAQAGATTEETEVQAPVAHAQVDELQTQLKQIMAQLEVLQGALHDVPQLDAARASSFTRFHPTMSYAQRSQKVEPIRVQQKVAS